MRQCRKCNHWTGLGEKLDRDDPMIVGEKVEMGICRRHAPRPGDANAIGDGGLWPHVASDDWCGEWEPDFH